MSRSIRIPRARRRFTIAVASLLALVVALSLWRASEERDAAAPTPADAGSTDGAAHLRLPEKERVGASDASETALVARKVVESTPRARLVVRCVAQESGAPIPGARVSLFDHDDAFADAVRRADLDGSNPLDRIELVGVTVYADGRGVAELDAPSRVARDVWRLVAVADGRIGTAGLADGDREATVALGRVHWLEVEVVGPGGDPVRDVLVRLGIDAHVPTARRTNDAGVARFDALDPAFLGDRARVHADVPLAPVTRDVAFDDFDGRITLVLPAHGWARITTRGPPPSAGLFVRVGAWKQGVLIGEAVDVLEGATGTRVLPAELDCEIVVTGHELDSGMTWYARGDGPTRSGAQVEFRLVRGEAAKVVGRVVDAPSGGSRAGGPLTVWFPPLYADDPETGPHWTIVPDQGGAFELEVGMQREWPLRLLFETRHAVATVDVPRPIDGIADVGEVVMTRGLHAE